MLVVLSESQELMPYSTPQKVGSNSMSTILGDIQYDNY